MLTIQQAGAEILGDNPRTLYFFGGEEYGIKCKYIDHLASYYKASKEVATVSDVISMFRKKQLIPLTPTVYVVRYDESFISELSEKVAKTIEKLNIIGTVVCLYENTKAISKCNKFFPDNTVTFDAVNPAFLKQYLKADFPQLSDKDISEAVSIHSDYMGAYNVCIGLNAVDEVALSDMTPSQIHHVFGADKSSSDKQLRYAFAAKDIYACSDGIANYNADKNQIFYIWLSTMLELEKLVSNPKQKSDLNRYIGQWDMRSIYNMFQFIYNELKLSRSSVSYNLDDRLLYLTLLLRYNPIPELGAM